MEHDAPRDDPFKDIMAVKIRLARTGAKKRPFYRIVAADARQPRDGRFLEKLGTYNPLKDDGTLELKRERLEYWLGVGATPTSVVQRLIRKANKEQAAS